MLRTQKLDKISSNNITLGDKCGLIFVEEVSTTTWAAPKFIKLVVVDLKLKSVTTTTTSKFMVFSHPCLSNNLLSHR